MEKLLKFKQELKKRKPKFLAQDSHKYKRIKNRWRKGRGSDSKIRHKIKGYRLRVEEGYRTPKALRGLTAAGLKKVYISNLAELKSQNLEKSCVVINGTVGKRKKIAILEECKKLGVKVLAHKNIDAFLASAKKEKKKETKTADKKAESKPAKKTTKKIVKKETAKEDKQ